MSNDCLYNQQENNNKKFVSLSTAEKKTKMIDGSSEEHISNKLPEYDK